MNDLTSIFDNWLIYSIEHRAWWKPAHRGYTTDIKGAGRYDLENARQICKGANIVELNEVLVPSPEWLEAIEQPAPPKQDTEDQFVDTEFAIPKSSTATPEYASGGWWNGPIGAPIPNWGWGHRILFDVGADANRRERELFERAFLAAMTGDWATDELMGNCNDQWYEDRARIYRRAAQAAVKVLTEASAQHPNAVAVLRKLLPFAERLEDNGPLGEGWRSDELEAVIKEANRVLAEAKE